MGLPLVGPGLIIHLKVKDALVVVLGVLGLHVADLFVHALVILTVMTCLVPTYVETLPAVTKQAALAFGFSMKRGLGEQRNNQPA